MFTLPVAVYLEEEKNAKESTNWFYIRQANTSFVYFFSVISFELYL